MNAWAAGTTMGPYELVARIGAGGMGEVWKARDSRLNRIVAIKRLKVPDAARFDREARAVAALNHPNICQIHDVGPDYLVLEFVDGAPLMAPYPSAEARRLAEQIVSALEAAHAKGVIHRDLKPANILVTTDGTVKLLDFGLARLAAGTDEDMTQTATGIVAGTASYMSPEQAQGKPLDTRSDLFSFGSVLYEMLSGAKAFPGGSTADVLSAVLRDDPKPLDGPAPLVQVVARCLRKAPADRFASASDLKVALRERAAAGPGPSIAVLPFANISRDPDDEYFSDGLAEEIINALAQIPGLKVIARTSAFAFKGQHTDVRRIAEVLGVRTVLEGSVRRAGARIRVTAQLIAAADGSHLWSQRYDRELVDVFEVQDDIAQAIALALRVKLDLRPTGHTPSLPAYEALLRGRHYLFQFTPESWQRAKACLEQAIKLDGLYTKPLATLGLGYLLYEASGLERFRVVAPRIRALAEQSLAADPSEPEPRFLLGSVAAAHDYDWAESLRQFRAAMAGPTVSGDARWAFASLYLQPLGYHRESVAEMRLAVEGDPLNASWRAILASHLVHAGNYDEAIQEVRTAIEVDPNHYAARFILIEALQAKGPLSEALAAAELAYAVAPWSGSIVGMLAGLLAQAGQAARGEALLRGLGEAHTNPFSRVFYHLLRSEIDLAADWYERAIDERELFAIICAPSPVVRPLRESERWQRLAALMKLPDALATARPGRP